MPINNYKIPKKFWFHFPEDSLRFPYILPWVADEFYIIFPEDLAESTAK